MLNKIAPLALVFALGFGSAAVANTDTGTIARVDTVRDTVTLTTGTMFSFGDEDYADRLKSFKPGDQVSISWHNVGSSMEATAISPVTAANTSGPVWDYPDRDSDHLD